MRAVCSRLVMAAARLLARMLPAKSQFALTTAVGRKAWPFVGSELTGQRAAIVMRLVQSARMQGLDPWAYLRDVLKRPPMQLNCRLYELLPHRRSAALV